MTERAPATDRRFERRQDHVGQFAPSHRHRAVVARGSRGRVAGEVFERGDDAGALQSAHVGGADHRHEIGVFADGLLDASPAVVAHDVEHGGQALVHAEGDHVAADGRSHPFDEVGVERRTPRERGRVDGRAVAREAGEALLVHERRDAEAVVLEHGLLLPHELGRALGGADRHAAVDARQMAEPVPARLLQRHRLAGGEHVLHRRDVERGVDLVGVVVARFACVQRLPSCATFSASVMARSSASTRALAGCAGSRHTAAVSSGLGMYVLPLSRKTFRNVSKLRTWVREDAEYAPLWPQTHWTKEGNTLTLCDRNPTVQFR